MSSPLQKPETRLLGLRPSRYTKFIYYYYAISDVVQTLHAALNRSLSWFEFVDDFHVERICLCLGDPLVGGIWSIGIYPIISIWMNINCYNDSEFWEDSLKNTSFHFGKGLSPMILLTAGVVGRANCAKICGEIPIDIYSWYTSRANSVAIVHIFPDLVTFFWLLDVGIVAINVDERVENEDSFVHEVI
jgi:hypothetical protein